MIKDMDRRDFMKLMGIGGIGVVFCLRPGKPGKSRKLFHNEG